MPNGSEFVQLWVFRGRTVVVIASDKACWGEQDIARWLYILSTLVKKSVVTDKLVFTITILTFSIPW